MADDIRERMQLQDEQRAGEQASNTAARLAQRQMEEKLHNPQFADTVRDADIPDEYRDDVGPDVSKAHAVANHEGESRERIYWLTKNKAERRVVESKAGYLLKENPGLLAIAQGAVKPEGIEAADSEPMTSGQRRRMRGSYEVSTAIKTLGVEAKGLDALTTATAEHRTVTNEQSEQSGVKQKVRAFFD